jgi:hypothetical protein
MGSCQSSNDSTDYLSIDTVQIQYENQLYTNYDTIKIDETGYVYHLYDSIDKKHICGNISEKYLNQIPNQTIQQYIYDKYGQIEVIFVKYVSCYNYLTQETFKFVFSDLSADYINNFKQENGDYLLTQPDYYIESINFRAENYTKYLEKAYPVQVYQNNQNHPGHYVVLFYNSGYKQDNTDEYFGSAISELIVPDNINDYISKNYSPSVQVLVLFYLPAVADMGRLYGGSIYQRYKLRKLHNKVVK